MKNNEMSFESIYSYGLGMSNINPNKIKESEESLFDGDFDALEREIRSEEAMLDYAETFQTLSEMNSAAKIKMCKKLKNITRGNTEYQASVESYLDKVMSMEEEAPAANGNIENKEKVSENNKPKEEQAEKKQAWYIKIWVTIKKIVDKIWTWIKERIKSIANHFSNNKIDEISDEEIAKAKSEDPDGFKEFLKSIEINGEKKSEDGGIVLTDNVVANLKSNIDNFAIVCEKFKAVVNQFVSQEKISNDLPGKMNEILNAIATKYIGSQAPKIGSFNAEGIKTFNNESQKFANSIDYDKNPAKYVKIFTQSDIVKYTNTEELSKASGINDFSSFGKAFAKRSNDILKELTNLNDSIDKISKSMTESNNIFINKMKNKNIGNDNGITRSVNENDKNADDMKMILELCASVTNIYKTMTKICGITQKVLSKIISEATNVVGEYNKKVQAFKSKFSYKFGSAMKKIADKPKEILNKYAENREKRKEAFNNAKKGDEFTLD